MIEETFLQITQKVEKKERGALNLENKLELWQDSQYKWLAFAAPATKGAVGKTIIKELCQKIDGFNVEPKPKNSDKILAFLVNGVGVTTKCAILSESGDYLFEQIYSDNHYYDIIIFLGFSPSSVNIWVFRKQECLSCMATQRKKENEKWAHVIPDNPPRWPDLEKQDKSITSQSGRLEDFSAVLSRKIAECHQEKG